MELAAADAQCAIKHRAHTGQAVALPLRPRVLTQQKISLHRAHKNTGNTGGFPVCSIQRFLQYTHTLLSGCTTAAYTMLHVASFFSPLFVLMFENVCEHSRLNENIRVGENNTCCDLAIFNAVAGAVVY